MSEEETPLSPEMASAVARDLMREPWLWATCDDGSPLGSDTGADAFSYFRNWRGREPDESALTFLVDLLRAWEIPDANWNILDPAVLERELPNDHFAILTRDDAVIAVAFSQLVVDGKIDARIAERALLAVERQAIPGVISFRGWVRSDERAERLQVLMRVLKDAAY